MVLTVISWYFFFRIFDNLYLKILIYAYCLKKLFLVFLDVSHQLYFVILDFVVVFDTLMIIQIMHLPFRLVGQFFHFDYLASSLFHPSHHFLFLMWYVIISHTPLLASQICLPFLLIYQFYLLFLFVLMLTLFFLLLTLFVPSQNY